MAPDSQLMATNEVASMTDTGQAPVEAARLRVLRVIAGVHPDSGGPPESFRASCIAIADAGARVTAAFPVDSAHGAAAKTLCAALSDRGIEVHTFEFSRLFPRRSRAWGVSWPLGLWLLRNARGYDVVHAHGAWTFTTLAALIGACLGRRPIALTPHESLTDFDLAKKSWLWRTVKRALRHAYTQSFDLLVFSSHIEQQGSPRGGRRGAAVTVPHPVNMRACPSRWSGRRNRQMLRLGFLGRFDEKKNLDCLIEAVARCPHAELRIGGAGPEEKRLRSLAGTLGIEDRIVWLGFLTGAGREEFFASIDLLAMPSAFECFGMAAAEAIALGVPVMVSPFTGISEIVERHGCGLIVQPDVPAITKVLGSLLEDRAVVEDLAARTPRALCDLSMQPHGDRLRREYERLVGAVTTTSRGTARDPLVGGAPRSTDSKETPALTTVICALDEQLHIDRCVESARELGPVFVVDGGSKDDTQPIARQHGAEVINHRWTGYAEQKNWALENLPIQSPWVLLLDADEYLTPALRAEIGRTLLDTYLSGFYLPRSNIFLGRRLRHAWWYPDYQLRLLRLGKGRYEDRGVHEHVILEGNEGFLREPLIHENLKGIDGFVERQLRYAGLEAQEMLARGTGLDSGRRRGRMLGTWPERRRALKVRVWYRMPGRPLIRFLWMYILRRGFLDGRQGLIYSQLIAFHEALINAKLFETRQDRPSETLGR